MDATAIFLDPYVDGRKKKGVLTTLLQPNVTWPASIGGEREELGPGGTILAGGTIRCKSLVVNLALLKKES